MQNFSLSNHFVHEILLTRGHMLEVSFLIDFQHIAKKQSWCWSLNIDSFENIISGSQISTTDEFSNSLLQKTFFYSTYCQSANTAKATTTISHIVI